MTYTDLIQMLEPVGLPIVGPGEITKALPCLTVEPVGMGTADGFSWLYDEAEIKAVVPLNQNNPKQFYELRAYTVAVWRQLWGTPVQVDSDGPLFGEIDTDPPSLFFTLSVRFPSDDLCDTPALPTPPGRTLTDEAGVPLAT